MAKEEPLPAQGPAPGGDGGDIDAVAEEARRLRKAVGPGPALEIFGALLDGGYGPLTKGQRSRAFVQALKCLASLEDWSQAEARAREAIAFDGADVWFRVSLGEALVRQGRLEEAEETLSEAIRLDPYSTRGRNLMAAIEATRERGAQKVHVRPWPKHCSQFEDPRAALQKYLLRGRRTRRFIRPDSAFMTLGSCFAENLAVRLKSAGRPVIYETIGEDVNSTFANRALLEWIEHGVRDETTEAMERVFGAPMRQRIAEGIRRSDVFVLTMGVASCFFDRATGRLSFAAGRLTGSARDYLYGHHVMRMTSVAENSENIRAIVASLERIAGRLPNIVLTVSPVPLLATTEFDTAIEADCLSKSTLRLACHEVMAGMTDRPVVYWPSFEIVKWLAAYYAPFSPPPFGAEDDNARHVSNWLVDLIIELFLDYYREPEAATA